MRTTLQRWARQMKTQLSALYLAYQDPRTPWYARVFALAVVAYAFSPIDLIPDMIPLLGYLDDVILLPVGIYIALRLIPAPVMAEARLRAATSGPRTPVSRVAAGAVIATWLLALLLVATWLWRCFLAPT